MKTFGKEIWSKKMKEQGDLGVIAGVRAKRKNIDTQTRDVLSFFDKEVRPLLKGNKAVDIGVGPTSRFLIGLSKLGLIVDGIDVSPIILDEAKKRAELAGVTSSKFFDIDITKESPKGKYDLVFCFGTFGHFPGYTALEVMRTFHQMLNKQGICMIHFWKSKNLSLRNILSNALYDFMRLVKLKFVKKTYLVSSTFYSEEDIKEMCGRTGFSLVKMAERPNYFIAVMSKK